MTTVFLIDVDNTLYPPEKGVFNVIDKRINRYMEEVLHIEPSLVNKIRLFYWNRYGTTMTGLIRHYNINPHHFLSYVHDVDVSSILKPNPALREKLRDIPMVKVAFTNAPKKHAINVLEALGIIDLFVDIFDITSADFMGKPNRYPYEKLMNFLGANSYVMADDWVQNLLTAKELGFKTVLVSPQSSDDVDICVRRLEDIEPEVLEK